MKTPFRLQASEYDCVPTTFINGLSYLFEREEIPPMVIQHVYLYCLDCISFSRQHGHGTSSFGTKLLGSWLSEYRHRAFSVEAEVIERDQVTLGASNRIARCLNDGGVCLMSVTHYGGHWHCILALEVRDRWIYAFDPYPKTARANKLGRYEFLEPERLHQPNLRIQYDWIDTLSNQSPFRLGANNDRECVLLRRREA